MNKLERKFEIDTRDLWRKLEPADSISAGEAIDRLKQIRDYLNLMCLISSRGSLAMQMAIEALEREKEPCPTQKS